MVDGVRFVPWERMADYCDLNPDVVVTSRWLDPLYWPALAGAKKVLWLQDAYFADPGRAFEVVDRVVVSSPWHRELHRSAVRARHRRVETAGHQLGHSARALSGVSRHAEGAESGGSGVRAERFGVAGGVFEQSGSGLQELAAMWPEIVAALTAAFRGSVPGCVWS